MMFSRFEKNGDCLNNFRTALVVRRDNKQFQLFSVIDTKSMLEKQKMCILVQKKNSNK